MIVKVPVAVDTKAERKRLDDLAEDHKVAHKEEEADHKEAEADRRAAAAVLDRNSVIYLWRASLITRPYF